MIAHNLKCDPEGFEEVWHGRKTHEMRFDDRNFQIGDIVHLLETKWSASTMAYSTELYPLEYTGRAISAKVTHMQTGYGLKHGWVLLSLDVVLPSRRVLRALVDEVWQWAREDKTVPSTPDSDHLIDRVLEDYNGESS